MKNVEELDMELTAVTFSSTEVMELAGITYRQLDYWCRSGLIPGQMKEIGSGSQRRFDEEAVRAVQRVATIMQDIEELRGELVAMRLENTRGMKPDSRRQFLSLSDLRNAM